MSCSLQNVNVILLAILVAHSRIITDPLEHVINYIKRPSSEFFLYALECI